jgi:predicted esterase
MKISNIIKEAVFGNTFTARLYQPLKGSNNWLIWYHGQGETGPDDGSQLDEVEKLPGFPKFAKGVRPDGKDKGSIEYPFNILAVQTEANYNFEKTALATYIVGKRKVKNLIVGGISLGGIAAMESILDFNDIYGNIKGVLNCCGTIDVAKASRVRSVPVLWWHGDRDTTVKYSDPVKGAVQSSAALQALGKPVEFITLPGVAHNAWDRAFTTDPNDKSLAFVNRIFAEADKAATASTAPVINPNESYNQAIEDVSRAVLAMKKLT